jgi:GH24 family phage-related lysozyme (muramidase)
MKMNRHGKDLLELYCHEFEPAEFTQDASKAIRLLVKTRLNSNQFSALVCLVCGISIDTFRKSTLLKMINRDDLLGAANAITNFSYVTNDAGRRVLDPPTLKHRELQKDLFLKMELVRQSKRNTCR